MKKFLGLIASVFMCFALTGCFSGIVDITINNDGSGTFTAQIGYTQMMYEMLKSFNTSSGESGSEVDELKPFEYNGVTYYGESKTESFASVEEFNSLINQNQQEIDSGLFTLHQEDDNSFTLNLDITSETGNTEEAQMNIEAIGMSQEDAALMMKDAVMVFTINMPGNIVQVAGDNAGITINGNSLTIDFLKLNVPTEPNITNTYTFTTKATENQSDISVSDDNKDNLTQIEVEEEVINRFSDVPTDLWSYEAIEVLAEGGLVSGVGNGRFSPERGMKISEFCQVVANAMGLESGADETGYWAAKAIKSCIDNGYIYSHGEINLENYEEIVTREEAIAAMQIASDRPQLEGAYITINDIPDGDQISDEYKDLVVQAYNSGITTGVNQQLKFSPKSQLTRGQVCQLFYNVNWTTKK